ncbi:hypothetical protein YC2023_082409 [Brassica napus]
MLQSLAKVKFFRKATEINEKRVGRYTAAEVAKLEKIKKKLKNSNGWNQWKRVVIARGMNQGCVIKRFQ